MISIPLTLSSRTDPHGDADRAIFEGRREARSMKFWARELPVGYYAPDDPEPGLKRAGWLARKMESMARRSFRHLWWPCRQQPIWPAKSKPSGRFSYNTDILVAHDEGLR